MKYLALNCTSGSDEMLYHSTETSFFGPPFVFRKIGFLRMTLRETVNDYLFLNILKNKNVI